MGDGCDEITSAEIAFISKDLIKEHLLELFEHIFKFLCAGLWVPGGDVTCISLFSVHSEHQISVKNDHVLEGGKEVFVRARYLLLHVVLKNVV